MFAKGRAKWTKIEICHACIGRFLFLSTWRAKRARKTGGFAGSARRSEVLRALPVADRVKTRE